MQRRGRSTVVILGMSALLLAACGSPAAPPPSHAPAKTASAPSAPAAPAANKTSGKALLPINVGVPALNMTLSSAFLAQKNGYYQKHGLTATVTRLHGSQVTGAALSSGNLQFIVTGASPFLLGQARGLKFVALAPVDEGVTSSLLVTKAWLKAHPIPQGATLNQKIGVLRGATVGTVSITDATSFKYLLRLAKIPATSVKTVKLGSQEAQFAALQHAEVDAIITSPPPSFQLEAAGTGAIVLNLRDVPGWGSIPYDVAATTQAYAKAHPKVVGEFTAAIEDAICTVASRSPQVLAYEETVYKTTKPAVVKQTLDFIHMTPYQPATAAQWKGLSDLLLLSGQIKAPYIAKQGVDYTNQFIPPAAGHSC